MWGFVNALSRARGCLATLDNGAASPKELNCIVRAQPWAIIDGGSPRGLIYELYGDNVQVQLEVP
jgi:hypothetical protein